MEITQHFDPSTLTDEQKNNLLTELYNYAIEYPNFLGASTDYARGYRDGLYKAHTILCDIFLPNTDIQGFDPND